MVAAWKAAGFTYNKYLSIAARVIRKSLKEQPRMQAQRRTGGELDYKFARWEDGKQGDPKPLVTQPST